MINTVSFSRLLNTVVGLFFELYELGVSLFNWFTQPLVVSIGTGFIPKLLPLPDSAIETIGAVFGDLSIASVMLGVGIFFYLGYQLFKWVLDVI